MGKELDYLDKILNYQPLTLVERTIIECIKEKIHRLESIDNANPSEALERLEWISRELKTYYEHLYIILRSDKKELISNMKKINEYLDTIKQALLKAQEPKHYLKWEDLEFKGVSQLDHKIIKAKLNEQLYELDLYRYGGYKRFEIRVIGNSYNYNLGEGYVVCIDEEFPETIQFFNDLHLERVEE